MWVIPEVTPAFAEKMEDVLDQYAEPLDPEEPRVCLDERPVQLHGDVKLPIDEGEPGKIKKRDAEYVRYGTANIFAAVEPKAGRHLTKVTRRRTRADFARMLDDISHAYPSAKKIHLIVDNLNTHSEKSCIETFGPEPGAALWGRFQVHYTPVHGSWLNQAEIEISMISREALGGDRFPNLWNLGVRVKAWNARVNCEQRKINWRFTTAKARKKFRYGTVASLRSGD